MKPNKWSQFSYFEFKSGAQKSNFWNCSRVWDTHSDELRFFITEVFPSRCLQNSNCVATQHSSSSVVFQSLICVDSSRSHDSLRPSSILVRYEIEITILHMIKCQLKNDQTAARLCSSHILPSECSQFSKLGSTVNEPWTSSWV